MTTTQNTSNQTTKRQFCRTGIHTCIPAVTLTWDGGARRLHWCAKHAADAEAYRPSSEQASARSIATGDRIYATENIYFGHGDHLDVPAGMEGTVEYLTGDDGYDLFVEFDNNVAGSVNSGSVALIP